jgi:CBS domain-containing protein
MLIKDVMTFNAEVIDADATVHDAAIKMRELDVGVMPVCAGGKLSGLITDRDIAIRLVAEGNDPAKTKVSDIMTPDVTYCFDDQTVEEAATVMEAHQIRRLPILDRDKQLVGILSLGDLSVRTLGTEDEDLAEGALQGISEPAEPNR